MWRLRVTFVNFLSWLAAVRALEVLKSLPTDNRSRFNDAGHERKGSAC